MVLVHFCFSEGPLFYLRSINWNENESQTCLSIAWLWNHIPCHNIKSKLRLASATKWVLVTQWQHHFHIVIRTHRYSFDINISSRGGVRKILYTYFSLQVIFLQRQLNNLSLICHKSFYVQILFAHTMHKYILVYSISLWCLGRKMAEAVLQTDTLNVRCLQAQTPLWTPVPHRASLSWADLSETEPTTKPSILGRNTI